MKGFELTSLALRRRKRPLAAWTKCAVEVLLTAVDLLPISTLLVMVIRCIILLRYTRANIEAVALPFPFLSFLFLV